MSQSLIDKRTSQPKVRDEIFKRNPKAAMKMLRRCASQTRHGDFRMGHGDFTNQKDRDRTTTDLRLSCNFSRFPARLTVL